MKETPIISKGIQIAWEYSDEYIEIDLTAVHSISSVSATIEWWREEKRWVKYTTTSSMRKINDKLLEIRIVYSKDKNPDLANEDLCWGDSVILIDLDTKSGTAEWIDSTNTEYNGVVTWKLIDEPLVGEIVREPVTRIQRNQARFRAALLALDECCTITGEKTKEVLEAAHIIPASSGGAEVIENGIILRADIHRLYDANLFTINEMGKIDVSEEVAEPYKNLLKNSQIEAVTLQRIQRALAYVSQS